MHEETFWRPMNLQDKMDYLHLEGQIEGIRLPTILPNECKNICNKVTKIVSVYFFLICHCMHKVFYQPSTAFIL